MGFCREMEPRECVCVVYVCVCVCVCVHIQARNLRRAKLSILKAGKKKKYDVPAPRQRNSLFLV